MKHLAAGSTVSSVQKTKTGNIEEKEPDTTDVLAEMVNELKEKETLIKDPSIRASLDTVLSSMEEVLSFAKENPEQENQISNILTIYLPSAETISGRVIKFQTSLASRDIERSEQFKQKAIEGYDAVNQAILNVLDKSKNDVSDYDYMEMDSEINAIKSVAKMNGDL